MGRENMVVGARGEEFAFAFLKRRGYAVLERNFRTPLGEIDIIAKRGGVIVFVEIKTRATNSFGPPYLAVTKKKERYIVKNALAYLKRRRLVDSDWRIDVVSVKLNFLHELENIELIENAVEDNG